MMTMTAEEAIDHLDKAASSVASNREGHEVLKQAVALLRQIVALNAERLKRGDE